jgi:hypothetical protein
MNNRQSKNLVKYALIAFVIYLVWRKMSSGYCINVPGPCPPGSIQYGGLLCRYPKSKIFFSKPVKSQCTGDAIKAAAEKVGMKIGVLPTPQCTTEMICTSGRPDGDRCKNGVGLGPFWYTNKTPSTKCAAMTKSVDVGTAVKDGLKIGSFKGGEIGLKSDAVKVGQIGKVAATIASPVCTTTYKCATESGWIPDPSNIQQCLYNTKRQGTTVAPAEQVQVCN